MDNPWRSINLSDYENHMKLDTVMQLQTLNDIMKVQLNSYSADSVMVLELQEEMVLNILTPISILLFMELISIQDICRKLREDTII